MRKHDVIHKTRSALHIARSSEDRDTATIVNMSVKFREVWSRDVFELSERTDTQTDRHTVTLITLLCTASEGEVVKRCVADDDSSAVDSRAQGYVGNGAGCVAASDGGACGDPLPATHSDRQTHRHAHRNNSNKAIADYTSPALCTPVTPFPPTGDAAYRQHAGGGPCRRHSNMHKNR